MPHPFDATLKDLVRRYPEDFKQLLVLRIPGKARVLNVDLSIVSAATDVVLGIGEPLRAAVDVNFQASRDRRLASRVLGYNALLYHQLGVPIHSIVVLLRKDADVRGLTGELKYHVDPNRGKIEFTFEIVRLWQESVRRFLAGPVGALPLAVLAEVSGASPRQALRRVLHEIDERVSHELSPPQIADLWAATFVLSGLRMPRHEAVGLFKGVLGMKESTTYQYIIEEGEKLGVVKGVHRTILALGEDKFGKPSLAIVKRLKALDDLDRLDRISRNMLHAKSWKELLDTP
jgi:hypothetical protein